MKNDENEKLAINPVKKYKEPKIPTLEQANRDSELLYGKPKRWIKRAVIIAGIAAIGTITFTQCAKILNELNIHSGGCTGVSAPDYFVYPTEQEVSARIFEQMEAEGIDLSFISDTSENESDSI